MLSEERFRKAPFSLRLVRMVGPTVEIKSSVFSPFSLWRAFSKRSVFVTVSFDVRPNRRNKKLRFLSEERFRKAPFSLRLVWMVGPTLEIKSSVFSPFALRKAFSKSSVFATVSFDGRPNCKNKKLPFLSVCSLKSVFEKLRFRYG